MYSPGSGQLLYRAGGWGRSLAVPTTPAWEGQERQQQPWALFCRPLETRPAEARSIQVAPAGRVRDANVLRVPGEGGTGHWGFCSPPQPARAGPSSPSWAGAGRAAGLGTGRSRAHGKFLTHRSRRGERFTAGGVSGQPGVDSENQVSIRLRFPSKSFFGNSHFELGAPRP